MLCAGLGAPAFAQGLVEFEVSPALEKNWSSTITAVPGQVLDFRVKISYTGNQTPFGLANMWFQPTFKNWNVNAAATVGDFLSGFVNDGGAGTTPLGHVPDVPGVYGRISPWGSYDPPSPLYGYLNHVDGTSYMRIAQYNTTSWIGQGNNTTGGLGMAIGQVPYPISVSDPRYPTFSNQVTAVIVLKLAITLHPTLAPRTMEFGAAEGFAGVGTSTLRWYADEAELFANTVFGAPTFVPATVHIVPSPASFGGVAGLLLLRRRGR